MKLIANWHLPLKTANEANSTEHWTKISKRHRLQKQRIRKAFLLENPQVELPCHIALTRISPRRLDEHDNLRMSLKWIVDAIAENIIPGKAAGRADDSKQITWEYRQEKGKVREYAVKIQIWSLDEQQKNA